MTSVCIYFVGDEILAVFFHLSQTLWWTLFNTLNVGSIVINLIYRERFNEDDISDNINVAKSDLNIVNRFLMESASCILSTNRIYSG